MAHVEKFKEVQLGVMLKHYERSNQNYSNENIDKTRTHLNYNLAPERDISQYEFIKKRCSEVRCLNREDVVKMCDWIITAPKDLPEEKKDEFFRESYNFLVQKYGEENMVSAYVHKDETTDHLHGSFVPVVLDKKKGDLKVSAKECITKNDLKFFHSELQNYLENKLKCKVNILNEATREGNLAMDEYKRVKASQDYQEARKLIEEAPERAAAIIHAAEEKAKAIEAEYEAKKAFCEAAREMNLIEGVKEVKTITGKTKSYEVPAQLWEAQIGSRGAQDGLIKQTERNFENYKELQNENFELKKENKALKAENAFLKGVIEKVKETFKDAPKRFTEALKSIFRTADEKSPSSFRNNETKETREMEDLKEKVFEDR